MSMEIKKAYFGLLLLVVLSCNSRKTNIEGAWRLESNAVQEPLPSKLNVMFLHDSPFSYEEVIYFTDSLIEYPLGFSDESSWPHRNFLPFYAKRDKIVIDSDTFSLNFRGGRLMIENQCFTPPSERNSMRFQYVDLQVKYDRDLSLGLKVEESGKFNLYHSVLSERIEGTFSSESVAYLAKLGSRLNVNQLNMIYNVGASDVREYELFLILNDETYAIKTFGLEGELPFELRAFIYNLIECVEQNFVKN